MSAGVLWERAATSEDDLRYGNDARGAAGDLINAKVGDCAGPSQLRQWTEGVAAGPRPEGNRAEEPSHRESPWRDEHRRSQVRRMGDAPGEGSGCCGEARGEGDAMKMDEMR